MVKTPADYLAKSPGMTMPSGYGFPTGPKPPAPAPPAGQYPGAVPEYGKPPGYGKPPNYHFAPEIDPQAQQQNAYMQYLAMQQAEQDKRNREAELFQIQSQYHTPRQSRIISLGGY